MNIHVNTDEKAPEEWTESMQALAIVMFWHKLDKSFRKYVIEELENLPHFCTSPSLGVVVAILKSLEEIDHEGLHKELSKYPDIITVKEKDGGKEKE